MKLAALSFFIPFWNEEENIKSVIDDVMSHIDAVAEKWELIIVNDGSSDGTLKIAQKITEKEKNVKVITHERNRGYGAALKSGLSAARYEIVGFMDGDGQFRFSDIEHFLDKIDKADIVIGYRKRRFDQPFRHVLMNLLKVWDLILFGFYFKDIDCGFKMFSKKALKKIMPLQAEGAMITTEILAKAKKTDLKILQTEVSHCSRKFGNQSGGNIRVILRAIRESFMIREEILNGRI